MLKKIFVISMLSIFVSSFCVIGLTKASESTGLIISPPIIEKTLEKSAKVTDKIKLTNASDNDLKITVIKKDFKANPNSEDGAASLVEPEKNNTFVLSSWVNVTDTFTLKSKEVKEVAYTITAPADAEPGGHYGSILFTPSLVNPTALNGSGTIIASEIGALILVNVPGAINYGAKIASFETAKKIYINSTNLVEFFTRFQNLSTVHVKPVGTIVVTNLLGKNSTSLVVNENAGNVLPDSIRKFTNSWEKKYGFGFYKATLSLTYDGNKNISSTFIFWIIPWKETLAIVVILILLSLFLSKLQWKNKQ